MKVLNAGLIDVVREIVLEGFSPHYDAVDESLPSDELWARLCQLNSQLWLDTGDINDVAGLWTREFTSLTTNNSLLNKEVQKGTYDELIGRSAERLGELPEMSEAEVVREIAFILNAYHGLRLVERFDAFVSVELHTDLSFDAEAAYGYGKRYYEICPQRFIVKVPFTAPGLVAAGRLGREGVPVNCTLGYSARQNFLTALIARPQYCNVFLGRLNQVIKENKLGDGELVGERAVAISQALVRACRVELNLPTRQIAASLRSGQQVADLAGVDVLTMPPKVAHEFLDLGISPENLGSGIDGDFVPRWAAGVDPNEYAINTLWEVPDGLQSVVESLSCLEIDNCTGDMIQTALDSRGFGDIIPNWRAEDFRQARQEGKIPKLENWKKRLAGKEIGLDALMTLCGLESFAADQEKMDGRIREHI